jgi:hypothetical protein
MGVHLPPTRRVDDFDERLSVAVATTTDSLDHTDVTGLLGPFPESFPNGSRTVGYTARSQTHTDLHRS